MNNPLVNYLLRSGVPMDVAQTCASKIERNAVVGAAAGLTVGLYTANPAALIMAAVAGAGVGTATLLGSPSCKDVRDAAFKIAFQL